jgi:hypothetical protein
MNKELTIRILLSILAIPNWVLGIVVFIWSTLLWLISKYFIKNEYAKNLIWQWILSYDQHANALAFGNPDEYMSTRAGKCSRKSGFRPCKYLCKLLNFIFRTTNHCEQSIKSDLEEAENQVNNSRG